MCGSLASLARIPSLIGTGLKLAARRMAHRGPDDSGTWWSAKGNVGLAQRRLAIIDLSPGGHQPMHDKKGGLTIVFNGEIYELSRTSRNC